MGQPDAPRLGTSFLACALAALVWASVAIGLVFLRFGTDATGPAMGYLLAALLLPWLGATSLAWLLLRAKRPSFLVLTLTTLPLFIAVLILVGAALILGWA